MLDFGLEIGDFGDVFIAGDGIGVDAGLDEIIAIFGNVGGLEKAGTFNTSNERADFGMGANEAIIWDVGNFAQGGVAAEDNNRINGDFGRKKIGESAEVGGVLLDGVIELVLFATEVEDLSPVALFAVAKNPAAMAFGFKNENSLLVYGEDVDLDIIGAGRSIGGARKVAVDKDILRREKFLKREDEAGLGGSEVDGVGRSNLGAFDFVNVCA